MANPIKFGTDGWRGIIAEDFTFDNVRTCAQAVAEYLQQDKLDKRGLVIGYDTRFASEDFAAAAAEVLAGNDIKVHLCLKPTPTPVVSFAVPATKSAGAIVITASHNPGSWNGFKYRSQDGASAPGQVISQIERNIASLIHCRESVKRLALDKALKKGVVDYVDLSAAYFERLSHLVDTKRLRRQKLNILVDSMYGAGIGYFKTVLQGWNLKITEINGERNPAFPQINPEPIARNLTRLSRSVLARKADVGLATDGDADRIGIVTEKGEFLNQLEVFSLLTQYFIEVRGERRPIVRSICSSNMINKLAEMHKIPLYVTRVGFKYIAPVMLEKDAFIGGEESGGYGFRGHVPERDGILAGLFFLDYMIKTGKTPSQLLQHLFETVGPHYYDRYDFEISPEQHHKTVAAMDTKKIDSVAGIKVTELDRMDGYKYNLEDGSWLLIRFSGTEPLIRIYTETTNGAQVPAILADGRKLAGLDRG